MAVRVSEPEWLKNMSGDSHLDSRDVLHLFVGCVENSDIQNIQSLIIEGVIPKPTARLRRSEKSRLLWKVSDVRDLIKSQR